MNLKTTSASGKAILTLAITITLIVTAYIHRILIYIPYYNIIYTRHQWYFVELIDKALIIIIIVSILYLFRLRPPATLTLKAPIVPAVLFGIAASAPMFIGFAITRKIDPDLNLVVVFASCVVFPFVEELQFRGFGFRIFRNNLHWRFMVAALPQALLFGAVHIEQGNDLTEMWSILLLLLTGALILAWLLDQWQNIWIAYFLHAFINLWWSVFSISDNAIGGWFPLCLQLCTMLFSVLITYYFKKNGKIERYKTSGQGIE